MQRQQPRRPPRLVFLPTLVGHVDVRTDGAAAASGGEPSPGTESRRAVRPHRPGVGVVGDGASRVHRQHFGGEIKAGHAFFGLRENSTRLSLLFGQVQWCAVTVAVSGEWW